ncbi:MAG: hypothetical protein WCJ47_11635 [Methanomicrobiales archaeon]|jgi:hypothetical protein
MADQQKTQEKKAWSTPMVIVLTRTVDETEVVLRDCKRAGQDGMKPSNQSEYHNSCNKVMYTSCTNFCARLAVF